jgi:hypothetical protein
VKRFTRDLEDPEEIGERHLALRRLLLRKQRDISSILHTWKQAAQDLALDEQRSDIVGRLVTKSLTTAAEIIKRVRLQQLGMGLRAIQEFKGKRIEEEYQKTMATQMIAARL